MHAMLLKRQGEKLNYVTLPIPSPNDDELLIKVHACGICRTDLHILDGDLKQPNLPLIPGHQIIGTIVQSGKNITKLSVGQRIGIPWLGKCCGHCPYCLAQQENLCDTPTFTGYQVNGGFAEYCIADSNFCFPLPENYPDVQAAPLLCAGPIGYRALGKTGNAKKIGIYGFGAAAHIVTQIANYQAREVYAFTRPGDTVAQDFARRLGVKWAGGSDEQPPCPLDAAIIFAADGKLVPKALADIRKGGVVVCSEIHMSDIPGFAYDILWGERCICSVANLTRKDCAEFLLLAPQIPIQTEVQVYPLIKTNEALEDLRNGQLTGAAVITMLP